MTEVPGARRSAVIGAGRTAPHVRAAAAALATGVTPRAAILVEGISDQRAVQALAERHGRDLDAEGVAVVAMGGATNIGHFLQVLGPRGLDVPLAGLCDQAEEDDFRRGLARAGLGGDGGAHDLAALGFHVCIADLEDELIRSLGVATVQAIVEAQGELGSFRTFQKQPAQRGRPTAAQLRRFMGTRSGRKIHYGRVLVQALDRDAVPAPLEGVLARV